MYLKAEFTQIKNLLVIQILKQEGIERGEFKTERTFKDCAISFNIESSSHPDLNFNSFFINGTRKTDDNDVCHHIYDTEEAASEAMYSFIVMINEINGEKNINNARLSSKFSHIAG